MYYVVVSLCAHIVILSNTSEKYHIPHKIAKARANHNGLSWTDFREKWRRRISNPYQFFAVSVHLVHILCFW